MQKLLRLVLLIVIALLSYSTSYSRNNANFSTGEVDSVIVSIDDIRKVNEKLTELKYEKAINAKLKEVVANDSVIIQSLKEDYNMADKRHKEAVKKVKLERNALGGVSVISVILLIISLL